MRFVETPLIGAFLIEPEPLHDERGWFARTFARDEFAARGLEHRIVQSSISYNAVGGTLRGMHYEAPPYEEAKTVSCIKGAVYDVVLDLRRESETFRQWFAAELTADNYRMMYVPPGTAHGFQTLTDGSALLYQISKEYRSESARGARWDDPAFDIDWPPASKRVMSQRDATYPDFQS